MAKESSGLPVYVVEDHNEVLPFIYRSLGSKHLPFRNLALVHFDSHPDLLLPEELQADDIFDKEKILGCVSIESWILPILYAGHISKVIWMKPHWADQILAGRHDFAIGRHKTTGKIRLTSTEDYFLSDGLYTSEAELENSQKISLHVLTVDFNLSEENENKIQQVLTDVTQSSSAIILDIDLDFFSTKNPFLDIYTNEQLASLAELYHFEAPTDKTPEALRLCSSHREQKLSELQLVFHQLAHNKSLQEHHFKTIDLKKVQKLISNLDGVEPDYEMVHQAGLTCDSTPLPHHVSSSEEIHCLLTQCESLFYHIQKPTIITVARSSDDDYCPQEQVNFIEDSLLKTLQRVYKKIDIKHGS